MMNTKGKTILLVEDEVFISMAQEKKLSDFGYNVITAVTGEEAVALACGDTAIDLILMDIDLGRGIDGTEAARQILECMDVPVVFLSSHTEPEIVEKTEAITSYGYVVKNSGPTVLSTSIKMAFKLFEARTIYKDTFSHSINGLCIHKMLYDEHNQPLDCEYISVNPAFEIHSGLSKDQLIGKTIKEIYTNNEADNLITMYAQVFGPESFIHEELYFEPTGRWFDLSVFPMTGDLFTVAVQNITDQKIFEQALQESEKKYRTIFEHAPLGIFRSTPEGRFLEVNFELAKMLGYDSPETVIREIHSIADQIYIKSEKRREIVDEQMQNESASHHVNHYRRRDGSEFIANLYLNTIRDDQGNPLYLEGIVEDITKQIEAENLIQMKNEELTALNEELNAALEEQQATNEELASTMEEFESANDELTATTQSLFETQNALRESEEKFRQIFEQHNAVMLLIEPDSGAIIDANNAAVHYYGYSLKEFQGMTVHDINALPPDEVDSERSMAAAEKRNYFIFPHTLASGETRTVEVYSSLIRINESRVLFSVVHDISERRMAEHALRESESRLQSYIDNAPYGVFIADGDGRYLEVNPAASAITGYSREELCSMSIPDLIPEELRKSANDHFMEVIEKGHAGGEFVFLHKDGSRRYWSVDAVTLSTGRFMGFVQDITARKQADHDLQERIKELHCLYDISLMMMETDISIDGVLHRTAARIPAAFQFPEKTAAQIIFEKTTFSSDNYRETEWMISSPIIINRQPAGSLIVCYLNDIEPDAPSPFLREEKQLIAAISERLGHIIQRIKSETKLQLSEERYRSLLEKSPAGIALVNDTFRYTYVNDEFCRIAGYEADEIIGNNFFFLLSEESKNIAIERYQKRQQGEDVPDRYEFTFIKKGGERRYGAVISSVFTDSEGDVYSMIQVLDVTDRKKAEDALLIAIQEADILREKAEKATSEKVLLLQEVHHRIKNNMSTIMSLLALQAGTTDDQSIISALEDARSRVQSMMVLYDKLYRSESMNELSLKEYLPPLVYEIAAMFPGSERISVETFIDEILLEPKKLFPLGIIVNELTTNSMKHAFTGRECGEITVSASSEHGRIMLTIQDNGIGFPESIHPDGSGKSGGFGIRLVGILVNQLNGSIRVERGEFTKFVIEFPG